MIDTLIFDAEGIVVDTETIWDKGQAEFLQRRGFHYDRERTKPLLTGRSLAEGVEIMKRMYGFEGDTAVLARERADIVRDLLAHETKFIEGFPEFFQFVCGHYKTCIATSMEPELLKGVDRRLGVSELFEGRIYTLADVDFRSKPNPDIFLYAAARLGSDPKSCLVIEDAPHGITAAKRAGMKCLAITTTYRREKLLEADLVVDEYAQIKLDVIERTLFVRGIF